MMLKEIKKIIEQVDFGILGKLAIIITIFLGVIAIPKYLWEWIKMLVGIDTFWYLVSVWVFTVFLLLLYERNYTKQKSKFEEKTEQYNELAETTKIPKTFDRALTVEINPIWYINKQAIAKNPGDKFPHLYFDIRVVNRTYHSFDEPEEITIGCFNGWGDMKDKVCEDTWKKQIGDATMIEKVSKLWKHDDGTFVFHCPITQLYGDLERWKLQGTVKYRSKDHLIGEDNQYANPEIGIKLKYTLSEKRILYLKKLIEEALGEDSK